MGTGSEWEACAYSTKKYHGEWMSERASVGTIHTAEIVCGCAYAISRWLKHRTQCAHWYLSILGVRTSAVLFVSCQF